MPDDPTIGGYDKNSNVTSIKGTGVSGDEYKEHNQSFEYAQLNRLTHHRIQKAMGFITTQYGYNRASHLTSVTTPNLHPWTITPTGSGLTDFIIDPAGNKDDHHYDKRGWLSQVDEIEAGGGSGGSGSSGSSLTRKITNTVLGSLDLMGDSIGRNFFHTYHANTQLLHTLQDPEKGEVSYNYDGLNRLQTETRHIAPEPGGVPQDSGTTYKYDANGSVEQIIDDKGNTSIQLKN